MKNSVNFVHKIQMKNKVISNLFFKNLLKIREYWFDYVCIRNLM